MDAPVRRAADFPSFAGTIGVFPFCGVQLGTLVLSMLATSISDCVARKAHGR
jgi:hypothetical protein